MVPVNLRSQDEAGAWGNRVATLAVELPLDEPDPRRPRTILTVYGVGYRLAEP